MNSRYNHLLLVNNNRGNFKARVKYESYPCATPRDLQLLSTDNPPVYQLMYVIAL